MSKLGKTKSTVRKNYVCVFCFLFGLLNRVAYFHFYAPVTKTVVEKVKMCVGLIKRWTNKVFLSNYNAFFLTA